MKKIIFILLLLSTLLYSSSISIAVAANVSYAINDLIKEFNKLNPDVKVKVMLGSSGKLTAQIAYGAPFDLFMSANMKYPNSLYKSKVAVTKPVVYAQGSLAMISKNPLEFKRGLELLKDEKIKRIAIGNPKTAPYGKATADALQNANIYSTLKSKFIYGESISQTLSYAVTAADIGFVAKSSLFSIHLKKYKQGVNWVDVDPSLYSPINQGLVILKRGESKIEVQAFYDFLLSPSAKEIFKSYGYLVF